LLRPIFRGRRIQYSAFNSVIEHLGRWDLMSKFAAQTQRVAPNSYVQAPAFW
jgi:hypothetical protein